MCSVSHSLPPSRTPPTYRYVVVDDSTGDDESDDEEEEVGRPLPTKAAARIGGGRAPLRGRQDDSDQENPKKTNKQHAVCTCAFPFASHIAARVHDTHACTHAQCIL